MSFQSFQNAVRTAIAAPPRVEVPMARPPDPSDPAPHSPDVTPPKGSLEAHQRCQALRAEASAIARQLRRLGSPEQGGEPRTQAGVERETTRLRTGAEIESRLAAVRAEADATERKLVESWLAAYAKARSIVAPAAGEAAASARQLREMAERPFKLAEAAEAAAVSLSDRASALRVEELAYRRKLDGLA